MVLQIGRVLAPRVCFSLCTHRNDSNVYNCTSGNVARATKPGLYFPTTPHDRPHHWIEGSLNHRLLWPCLICRSVQGAKTIADQNRLLSKEHTVQAHPQNLNNVLCFLSFDSPPIRHPSTFINPSFPSPLTTCIPTQALYPKTCGSGYVNTTTSTTYGAR